MVVSSFHHGDEHADRRSTRFWKKIARIFQYFEGSPLHGRAMSANAPRATPGHLMTAPV